MRIPKRRKTHREAESGFEIQIRSADGVSGIGIAAGIHSGKFRLEMDAQWITGTVWCFRSDMADCIGFGRAILTAADSGAKAKGTPPKRCWYIFFVRIGYCSFSQQYGAGLVWGGSPNQEPDRCSNCILSRWAG